MRCDCNNPFNFSCKGDGHTCYDNSSKHTETKMLLPVVHLKASDDCIIAYCAYTNLPINSTIISVLV